ncbi:preprotein translocase subunit SecG [Aestuariicella hydrocarbonica]|uniref:Protein-export membrane protein SecG n=1 Tax=Pseudomaricurvus hydrocarbonicus TaxID=1470433 RepID=A0A9E5MLL0_9GAMM|nr:preprotein translocase subunit SecG [Aestuariicella hydrocarbonica]NHO64823.1 preprotein translocase subunit SecG [Aestuariicella hydrocarbonica]
MEKIILVLHLLTAVSIIALILLQQGKGAEAGASFGAGASQTVFGSSGSGNFFTRATALLAAVFFATSFGLAVVAKQQATVGITEGIPVIDGPAEIPAAVEVDSDVPGDIPSMSVDEVPAEDIPSAPETVAPEAEMLETPAPSDEESQ